MSTFSLFVFFLVVAGCVAQEPVADEPVADERASNGDISNLLQGRWKEDQYKRKNLNNYLYEMGEYGANYFLEISLIISPFSYPLFSDKWLLNL